MSKGKVRGGKTKIGRGINDHQLTEAFNGIGKALTEHEARLNEQAGILNDKVRPLLMWCLEKLEHPGVQAPADLTPAESRVEEMVTSPGAPPPLVLAVEDALPPCLTCGMEAGNPQHSIAYAGTHDYVPDNLSPSCCGEYGRCGASCTERRDGEVAVAP